MRWMAGIALLASMGCDPSPGLCRDTALRLAQRDARCDIRGPGPVGYEELLGGCDEAHVSNGEQLTEQCWPAIEAAGCGFVELPEACRDQF